MLLPAAGLTAQEAPEPEANLHAPFDALLRRHVRDERVDYLTWRDHDADELARYLDRLAAVEPAKLGRDERLAFYINLYNATMIGAVLRRVDATYSPSANDWSVFDEKLVRVAGRELSLDQLEHEIVRKEFGDPRIHVALVCAAESCPPLLPRAYRGDDLDEVLEANMRRFVRDPRRNRIERDPLELSKLFEWYAADFGGAEAVPAWVARYAGNPELAEREVEFIEYSWTLNLAEPARGRWVRVVAATDELAAGQLCEVVEETGKALRLRLPFDRGEVWVAADAVARYPGE